MFPKILESAEISAALGVFFKFQDYGNIFLQNHEFHDTGTFYALYTRCVTKCRQTVTKTVFAIQE